MTVYKNYTKQQIADACRRYGCQLLNLPAGVNGAQLLWALSGNESSFGADCNPRLEPAYWTGKYSADTVQAKINKLFGPLGASSSGPWQVMAINAWKGGISPADVANDLDKAARATVGFLNRSIAAQWPLNLADIFDMYNSGNWKDTIVPHQYIADGVKNYGLPMPAEGGTNG